MGARGLSDLTVVAEFPVIAGLPAVAGFAWG